MDCAGSPAGDGPCAGTGEGASPRPPDAASTPQKPRLSTLIRPRPQRGLLVEGECKAAPYSAGSSAFCLAILSRQTNGAVWCADSPVESTATVTGMSRTSNS